VLIWLNLASLFVTLVAVAWAAAVHRWAKKLVRHDDLTGALNRRGFIEVLGIESKRSRRYLHPLTVAYVDVDNFKLVNDIDGHKAGNVVLREVARTMQSTLREVDFVARLGGDEFALFLSETGTDSVRMVLDKLRTALMNAVSVHTRRVTFSIGAVTFNNPLTTAEEMIAKADELMYSVKLRGKDHVEHLIMDTSHTNDHIVRCSTCRTSFAATSHTCPICGSTALLDLKRAEDDKTTQRGVQAYITNLEGELSKALRSLEATLDILTDPTKLEHSRGDCSLRLCEEDVQKIAVAVGVPENFWESDESGPTHRSVLSFREKVAVLRKFPATRRNSLPCYRRASMSA
jgi:diguanylate cyclase (GGDEF)-like protein